MATQQYYGLSVEGTATQIGEHHWLASGRVTQGGAVVVQSSDLGVFPSEERAMADGIAWGKDWIDAHQRPAYLTPDPQSLEEQFR
ncbi:hypothetical protein [Cupriavidus pauculus]|uniref:hypothetical protein n=1 Tax=Cupriavidus pauculus TaxID=82633 RepID=UPI0015DD7B6F|nr:hypothetical protein [Cupriavidus pauculus]